MDLIWEAGTLYLSGVTRIWLTGMDFNIVSHRFFFVHLKVAANQFVRTARGLIYRRSPNL